MNDEQLALLARINDFSLDVPGSSFPFSKKLAAENHWPTAYCCRVIEEYKRFAFLAVAAGHPISPSEAVDQAWHMHLTYTQNYWRVFCPEVLGMPFHHNPSQGGKAEREKFDDWYRKTLESYKLFFGTNPPTDIWPTPAQKRKAPPRFVRVDKTRHWVIPKPELAANAKFGLIGSLSVFVLGCEGATSGANPFDFTGPEFLRFYFLLAVACIALGHWARYALRMPITRSGGPGPHLDGYQLAYLNQGRWLVIDAAIAALVQKKVLEVVPRTAQLLPTAVVYGGGPPLEEFVYQQVNQPTGISLRNLRLACRFQPDILESDLKNKGLLVPDNQISKVILIPLAIAGIAVLVGVMKIYVGISRERPIDYLVAMTAITFILSLVNFARKPFRSRYGDTVLQQIRDHYDHLRHVGHHNYTVDESEIVMAVGLFGVSALAGSDLGYLTTSLRTPPTSSSGCSTGSCGGGGGGGSCSSGDGGGGGSSCGGGGCGGCGGG